MHVFLFCPASNSNIYFYHYLFASPPPPHRGGRGAGSLGHYLFPSPPPDLLVPIFSFSYCGIGLILIIMSIRQCDSWSKAYHLKLLDVLDVYFDHTETRTFRWVDFGSVFGVFCAFLFVCCVSFGLFVCVCVL